MTWYTIPRDLYWIKLKFQPNLESFDAGYLKATALNENWVQCDLFVKEVPKSLRFQLLSLTIGYRAVFFETIVILLWKKYHALAKLSKSKMLTSYTYHLYQSLAEVNNLGKVFSCQKKAKGTKDPRIEFISQILTQILIKFHLKNLDQVSTSKSQPIISLTINLKLQNLDQTWL